MSENLLKIVFHRSSARVSGNRVDSRLCHWREFMARVLVAREKPATGGGRGESRRFVVIGILQSEALWGRTNTMQYVKLTTDKTFFVHYWAATHPLTRESDAQPLRFIKKSLAKALINNSQRSVDARHN